MKNWARSRREFLKGMGLGVGFLPLLAPEREARGASAPRRAIFVVNTNGYSKDQWIPDGEGTNLLNMELKPTMKALDPFKKDLVIFPALTNTGYSGAGHGAYGTVLSPGPNNGGQDYWTPKVPTLDRICADAAERDSGVMPFRTLPLQVQVDRSGERRLGATRCFFSGDNKPVGPESSPYRTVDRLFSGGVAKNDPAASLRLRAERRSLLDHTRQDLVRFAQRLGSEDKSSIEGYLESVRDIEKQLESKGNSAEMSCKTLDTGAEIDFNANTNYPKTLKLQLDIAVAALRCGATRVVTLQLATAHGDGVVFSWLGIGGKGKAFPQRDWHDVAHHEVINGRNEKIESDAWFVRQFAYLLEQMKAVDEGGKSLLHSSIVLWANHMYGDGFHSSKLPWVMAGEGGGYIKTGQYMRDAEKQPKTRVMADIANAMGAKVEFLGSKETGTPLPGLRNPASPI